MCLLFFSYKLTPGNILVVAANRDEFQKRPTLPLNYIDKEKTIVAGQDLQAGGSWLGITKALRFAALTNFRSPKENSAGAPTRGELVTNFLSADMSGLEYGQYLLDKGHLYNGFNLVFGDSNQLYYYSNQEMKLERLRPGFYGLSNHLLDTPWPKVTRGKELLSKAMVSTEKVDSEKIFTILQDKEQPEDEMLPDTGVGLVWERLLATMFIDSPGYGTRSSAIISVSETGLVQFTERSYTTGETAGLAIDKKQFAFQANIEKFL